MLIYFYSLQLKIAYTDGENERVSDKIQLKF